MADPLTEYAMELFEPLGGVSNRRMFGGVGFFKSGLMFGLIAFDEIYLKADKSDEPAFLEAGSEPFVYEGKGKPMQMGYWKLPEHLHEDEDERRRWVEAAFETAIRADNAKPPSQRKLKPGG
jgi:DNA transformation protein